MRFSRYKKKTFLSGKSFLLIAFKNQFLIIHRNQELFNRAGFHNPVFNEVHGFQ